MPLDLDWDVPLAHRQGGATYLDGIDVYYDFDWFAVLRHERAQFTRGQCVAQQVRAHCPEGKTPALLLTDRDGADEGFVETPLHLVLVLNLPEYITTSPNASLSYLASRLGSGIRRIGQLNQLADADPEEIRAFLQLQLNVDHITAWAADNEAHLEQIRDIPGVRDPGRTASVAEVVAALHAMEGVPAEVVDAVAALFGPGADRDDRLKLLRAVTEDPDGRHVTGEVVFERAADRMADTRRAVTEYEALLDAPASTETDLQQFIERNPWLLGLEYVNARPRREVPRGTLDFILERFDGFHDIMELKNPADPIIKAPDVIDGVQPSPSRYALSPDLAQALAQAHVYREILTIDAETVLRRYGLEYTRDPQVIIVIGRTPPSHRADVLRELNKSLHRVEIVPYDLLASRAAAVLDNVEKYLLAGGEAVEAEGGAEAA